VQLDKTGAPDFFGPFVQGPPQERFVYLDMGGYAGQDEAPLNGRLKIPLSGITKNWMEQQNFEAVLQTTISGRNAKNNGSQSGTVKPFNGWKLETHETDVPRSNS